MKQALNDEGWLYLWAKSGSTGGLPLISHMLDVAAVACELLGQIPVTTWRSKAHCLGLDPAIARRWIAALVGCHDLGKATPGFQALWDPGKDRVASFGFDFPVGAPSRHDAGTALFLAQQLATRGCDRKTAKLLADAVAAHHGSAITPVEHAHQGRFTLSGIWTQAHAALTDAVFQAVGISETPQIPSDAARRGELFLWLAGLCATADWIGSSEAFFPQSRSVCPAKDWFNNSRQLAQHAVRACGLAFAGNPAISQARHALQAALAPGMTARPLQLAVMHALEALPTGPALMVIEAPMGEGKTEAAFTLDAWLRGQQSSSGIYVAMPTQATSNALFARTAAYLKRLSLHDPIELQLAHGGSTHEQTHLCLHEIGFGGENASVMASAWLSGTKRVMLAPNAVGTVDQALVGVLHARHHFVRYYGLTGRLVVFDEVHAYDTYTSGLIERLIAWLRAADCSVLLMSATLPHARLTRLAQAFGAAAITPASYPRISVVGEGHAVSKHVPARRTQPIDIAPMAPSVDAIARQALADAASGAAVLVVVNKVQRAQAIYRQLFTQTQRVMLFHARFPMNRRLEIENEVIRKFSTKGADRGGWILVATQVAEQSLDVDLDVLITDLAPIDLLLQRTGRIHRHARQRAEGYETPKAYIVGWVDTTNTLPPSELTRWVYDSYPVLRTAFWLGTRKKLHLPDDIELGVQWVYGSEAPYPCSAVFAEAHESARIESQALQQHESALADKAALPLPQEWQGTIASTPVDDEAASSGVARFGTRLGSLSLSCIPIYLHENTYATDQPGAQTRGMTWPADQPIPKGAAAVLGQRYLRISSPPLIRQLLDQPRPIGWQKHPELAGHVPLCLDAHGQAHMSHITLHLDAQEGLAIEYQTAP